MSILNRKPGIIHDALDTQRVLDCVSKQPSWYSLIKYVKEKYNWGPEPSPEKNVTSLLIQTKFQSNR